MLTDQILRPMVLMYHSVERYERDPFQVTVHPDRFLAQLRWLRRNGLRGAAMAEVLRDPRPDVVGLTFDDGYADFVTEVMPALARYGCTATVYVVAGALGGTNAWDAPAPAKPLMTAEQVRQAAAAGMEIGSHGLLHRRLPDLSEQELFAEVMASRSILAELSGQPVTGFCYPYGAVGEREVEAVREAGYHHACAVYRSPLDGIHALPRTYVGDRDGGLRLTAKRLRHRLAVRSGGGAR